MASDTIRSKFDGRRVLFVCLGNICRSPMAELALIERLRANSQRVAHMPDGSTEIHVSDTVGWIVDSAGTAAYHVGDSPDPRTVDAVRKAYAATLPRDVPQVARQLEKADFGRFDFILVMDESNLRDAVEVQKQAERQKSSRSSQTARLQLLGEFDPEGARIVQDPYYGGKEGFAVNLRQIERCLTELIHERGA